MERGVEDLVAGQLEYYELRAPEFDDPAVAPDRRSPGGIDSVEAQEVVDRLAPYGDVLELACGSGAFTRHLVRHARTLTCVDGSPQMLAINAARVAEPRVAYVCADLFTWEPPRTFDDVVFGFWLSHVPPTLFDRFWELVASCLVPGGRAVFVDEDERAVGHEADRTGGPVPTARRRLRDGRTFEIVKVFWDEHELEQRLASLGWQVGVRPLGASCYLGTARRPGP